MYTQKDFIQLLKQFSFLPATPSRLPVYDNYYFWLELFVISKQIIVVGLSPLQEMLIVDNEQCATVISIFCYMNCYVTVISAVISTVKL